MSSDNPINSTTLAPLTTAYDLKSVLELLKKQVFLELNCHAIGTVQSFNSVNQTARVSVNYQRTFYKVDDNGAYNPYLLPYPLLIDCPVICLGGGSAALTFPITAGDECLILFNDRNIDNWFASNFNAPPATGRLHSFTDAIVLVGLRSSTKVIQNYDTGHAVIRSGTGRVGVNTSNSKAYISNNGVTLGQALQNFCTACASSSDTTLVSAAAALSTILGGILE